MKTDPLVLEIKGNSLDDGPGIRSVVFFKGCPLECVWCHNPESKKRGAEISFDAADCIGCNNCIEACASGALSRKNRSFIDRERCDSCFSCVESCPSGALSRVGQPMEVNEIVEKVLKDKPFFNTSGGGVTLSGGEPTLDMAYTSELMKELKSAGINVLIETCGLFSFETFRKFIYPFADTIYFDIKLMDSGEHKKFCGVTNEIILDNFVKLHREYMNGGIEVLPRTPLIPDITDTVDNMAALAAFYRKHGVTKTALLSYNPLWHDKNTKLGIKNSFSSNDKMRQWISKEKEVACRKIFKDEGIEVL